MNDDDLPRPTINCNSSGLYKFISTAKFMRTKINQNYNHALAWPP